MAATQAVLTQGASALSSGGAALNTAAITPEANQLVLVWLENNSNNKNSISSGTGSFSGVVWTSMDTQDRVAGQMSVFRGVPGSSASGTIQLNVQFAGVMTYLVSQYGGVNQATNQGAVQIKSTWRNTSTTNCPVTMSAFAQASNATVYGAFMQSNTTVTAKTTDYTLVTQASTAGTMGVEMLSAADTTPNATFAVANAIVAFGIELSVTSTAGSAQHHRSLLGVGV
jgi:hypothetical protein